MARHGTASIVASGLVLAASGGFAVYVALSVARASGGPRYEAVFTSGEGLAPGTPVTLAGVVVGAVRSVRLDDTSMTARVAFTVRRDLRVPADSGLAVVDTGATGGEALALTPGTGAATLAPGAVLMRTTAATSIESRIGNYIFGAGLDGGSK